MKIIFFTVPGSGRGDAAVSRLGTRRRGPGPSLGRVPSDAAASCLEVRDGVGWDPASIAGRVLCPRYLAM
jgi:hypothetical protein